MSTSPAPTMTFESSAASTAGPSTPLAIAEPPTVLNKAEDGGASEAIPLSLAANADESKRFARLEFLLKQSSAYASVLRGRMERQDAERAKKEKATEKKEQKSNEKSTGNGEDKKKSKKRAREDYELGNYVNKDTLAAAEDGEAVGQDAQDEFGQMRQPALVTGASLRDYQLAGVQWLASLHSNGLNGILADEMGLGKTLQTISLLAHLREVGVWGPFLIVCPLSVMHNWVAEFEKFAPSIPVVMYHGSKAERAELQRTALAPVTDSLEVPVAKRARGKKGRKSLPVKLVVQSQQTKETFPVVVTTYEMVINDKPFLSSFTWKHLIVDEGHRLKNMECRLIKEIKQYNSDNRLILTGTPLHNNLAELWSLLNFILPDIFDDLDAFQQWFNFDHLTNSSEDSSALLSQDQTAHIINSLHDILKPFLLRRLKVDVEVDLPPKKEYVLYAPLTKMQKELYDAIVGQEVRQWLIEKKTGIVAGAEQPVESPRKSLRKGGKGKKSVPEDEGEDETKGGRWGKRLRRSKVSYRGDLEDDDDKYFAELEKTGGHRPSRESEDVKTAEQVGQDYILQKARKSVTNMNLQNRVMQLRKVCSHPFLFDWPTDPDTGHLVINDELVGASGKMLLLDRLLGALFEDKHKVLLFSQFTTMLDVIEDWARYFKHWDICRIDGSTPPLDRRAEMDRFNNGGDAEDACKLFLLSTRAGGLGINLVAADTVIFYDGDWNPQMDLQAQDRAHRIGQKNPVLIFRLVSAHTVETTILQRAAQKRRLEALVIAKGKFKAPGSEKKAKQESVADLAASLLALEGEKINIVAHGDEIISDKDLSVLLDRSPEVFSGRLKGWSAGDGTGEGDKSSGPAFEVFELPTDEGNAGLARMMGEVVED